MRQPDKILAERPHVQALLTLRGDNRKKCLGQNIVENYLAQGQKAKSRLWWFVFFPRVIAMCYVWMTPG